MRLQRITELVYHRPWLITPVGHESIRSLIEQKLSRDVADGQHAGILDDLITARPAASVEDRIGHVHIMGAVGIGFSKLEKTCGNTDVSDILAEITEVQEKGAERIMLHVDSPGGTVGGIPEASEQIAKIGIPTFAYVAAGAMNCSAAYYLTAGCDRIYASHSADIGSIGVYRPWIDRTEALARMGYKVELITNKEGDLKGTGYPGTKLSDEQRQYLEADVQETFDDFAAHVRANRPGAIDTDTMRGQSFSAREAYKRNLIDGVVPYESALRSLKRFKAE
ncbi:MAG TPA: S49 family peptidase [Chthoniobacteraceae bacterium]|jgi:signal peptide peptidase SppA